VAVPSTGATNSRVTSNPVLPSVPTAGHFIEGKGESSVPLQSYGCRAAYRRRARLGLVGNGPNQAWLARWCPVLPASPAAYCCVVASLEWSSEPPVR
jgi:hypothetical protein